MLDDIPARMARIEAYDLSFLRKRFMKNHPQYAYRFDECVLELKRLFALMLEATGPLEVASLAVDALLGEFIHAEPEYQAFCEVVYGEELRRSPAPEGYEAGGKHAQALYRLYKKRFGSVREIWYEDMPVGAAH